MTATTAAGRSHQRCVGEDAAAFEVEVRPRAADGLRVDDLRADAVVREVFAEAPADLAVREADDARELPLERRVVADAPLRVFLGAMRP